MAYGTSASDRLAEVRAAIQRCLTSQSYSVAGRSQSMASLGELRKAERELMDEVNQPTSMCSLGVVGGLTR